MIHLSGISFGYGLHFGITHVLEERTQLEPLTDKQNSAIVLPFLPNDVVFSRVASTSGIEFCIIPPCSYYSHLAEAIWSCGIPTISIQQPWYLLTGVSVLADFDNGLLLVAESKSEEEELQKRARNNINAYQNHTTDLSTPGRSLSTISILAEVASAKHVLRALSDGADGLGVVNGERLFPEMNRRNPEAEALVYVVKANPHVLPLPIRFFDPNLEIENNLGKIHVPQRYLGYRGVRILGVDDAWFQRFVAGLDMLDLEQIIVILPMVTSVSEVQRIRDRLGWKWNRVGVTVETPAAALKIKELLDVSDFIQIGLNDLTQYTMAWDRDVPNQELLPIDRIAEPVGDLVASVASACASAGVTCTLAMDLPPSNSLVAQVLQLGVTSVSCAPSLIKPWKKAITTRLLQ